jgi:hypothetical protein
MSGRHGFAIRIVPGGPMFEHIAEPGLIAWDKFSAPVEERRKPAEAVAAQP